MRNAPLTQNTGDLLLVGSGVAIIAAAGTALTALPATVPLGMGSLALVFALGALVAVPRRSRPANAAAQAVAVTRRDGTVLAVSDRFAELCASEKLRPHPDSLAEGGGPDAQLALFNLRRMALAEGRAQGFVPPSFLISITRDGPNLTYAIERTSSAPHASPNSTLADAVIASAPAPLCRIADGPTIENANAGFKTLLGDASSLAEILILENGDLKRFMAQARARGEASLEAALAQSPDRRVRLSAKTFPPDRREGAPLLIAASDITERSQLEAQLAQNQKMNAIGELAGNIAHDFNNVLTGIIGFSDLLLQNHRPSDPAFSDIIQIKQNAQRAARLVRQLLAFSRRQTLRPTVVDLNEAIADMWLMLDRLLGETVQLNVSYGRDLWPVLADLSQVEQVIINLAVNARDAMPGGGKLTIRTRNTTFDDAADEGLSGDAVVIEVEDVGTGMPPDVLEKIFEPFFTTKAAGRGTGLGLATVYGIVKQTGGALTVDSVEGQGTAFRIFLPRSTETAEDAVADAPAEVVPTVGTAEAAVAPPPAADLTGSATLLLVEDEEAVRAFAARALSAKGYSVLSAASGVDALEIFEDRGDDVDLLLTDVIMPELDGPALVKQIRAERPDLKVVFMSGYADVDALDGIENVQFLPKPFTLKALAETVKQELSR